MALFDMVCAPGTGCPLDNLLGIGLPEILLWVLAFAIIFGVLKYVMNKRSALLVAIALAFFVLMAIPATLITFIASMSTSLIVLLIGVLAVLSVINLVGPKTITIEKDAKGNPVQVSNNWIQTHGTITALVVLALVALVFIASGGLALLGLQSLVPMLNTGTILLVIVGLAVLWLVAEAF